MLSKKELSRMIDHTNLKPYATEEDLRRLCAEAAAYGFAMVAVNPAPVMFCKACLRESSVHVGAAVSFPLGQTTIQEKLYEARQAIADGADEIDYVINIGKVKEKNFRYIENEMQSLVGLCRESGTVSKVIFENCYLTSAEIAALCEISSGIRPDYVKTSTGFGLSGAKPADVALMKSIVKDTTAIKAAGGIRSLDACLQMIDAGASRIGTSSSLEILNEYDKQTAGSPSVC
ncbi:deoxyribose-phosphate aldolase [Clostridium sp. Marseille-P3244]|uniref:deoxyribose-phosphate aldolase n=1 Tax=Clostridium sp. Marseille-P3244 TaxID=1871020 RepID=UPI000B1771E3|nr:deoxyribose-phosphate aldolase [Clostridium sp. Marseille-P3244]